MKNFQKFIKLEKKRQNETIGLIASENFASPAVLAALGSCFNDKYAEGYPGKRYYAGNQVADQVELDCQKQALTAFGLNDKKWQVNVQPYSGSPANLAIYLGLLKPGAKILAMGLSSGGHLTHGHSVSITGQLFEFVHYGVDKNGWLDYEEILSLAKKTKPAMIVAGATAYPRRIDFARFRAIADQVDALLMADISHIAGLIVSKQHPSCFPDADVIMTTTHKTLRGPRGAMIFSRLQLAEQIDKAVFPGLQGGPHLNSILAKGVALAEAQTKEFAQYQKQIILNAQALAEALKKQSIKLVTGGTDNHLMLLDLSDLAVGTKILESRLEAIGIIVNKNTIPGDKRRPFDPSGIRLGVPAVTTRGMKEPQMQKIAEWIRDGIVSLGSKKVNLSELKLKVKKLALEFPAY